MIGAIADWFAVVALFRRPLGLPIPHTAIIPRNKERIARGLSEFIQQNFLQRAGAGAAHRRVPPGAHAVRLAAAGPATPTPWPATPRASSPTRSARWTTSACAASCTQNVAGPAASTPTSRSAAAGLLDILTENKRHHALLDAALAGLDDLLAREDTRALHRRRGGEERAAAEEALRLAAAQARRARRAQDRRARDRQGARGAPGPRPRAARRIRRVRRRLHRSA